MIRISNVKGASQPNFIEVRQYTNSLINIQKDTKPIKSDFAIGFWRVKGIDIIPKEYAFPTHS